MKTALIHEWLTPEATGGSELVVAAILQVVEADLFALIDFESTNPHSYLYGRTIGTTFLQQFPQARQGVQKYLPLLPIAIEQLNVLAYDRVLSSSHAVAKGILTRPDQLHICYCHTPMRYAWDLTFDYLENSGAGRGLPGVVTRLLLHYLRQWDTVSANRVDYFIANSQHTARRIWRCYRRPAEVVYPPVNVDRFTYTEQKQEFYLTVCRLVSYKQVRLIIEAFNRLQLPLVIIGGGSDLAMLKRLAQGNVQLLGAQPNAVVEDYMAQAKAFVYAACEDFGIALVEAQACGTPVIAYGRGGARETVRDARAQPQTGTGLHFARQEISDLVETVRLFEEIHSKLNPESCRQQALKFAPSVFEARYLEVLDQCNQDWRGRLHPPLTQSGS